MPSAKAMSVAAGIAQPRARPGVAPAIPRYTRAGHRHARRRRDGGQDPSASIRQAPVQAFAFDLQADEQEKHRHQPIVDAMMDRHPPADPHIEDEVIRRCAPCSRRC
jgi:hypothetical protein